MSVGQWDECPGVEEVRQGSWQLDGHEMKRHMEFIYKFHQLQPSFSIFP